MSHSSQEETVPLTASDQPAIQLSTMREIIEEEQREVGLSREVTSIGSVDRDREVRDKADEKAQEVEEEQKDDKDFKDWSAEDLIKWIMTLQDGR